MTAPTFSEIELALTSTALAGDAGGLYRITSSLMEQGVPFDEVLFDYLIASERSVGRRWQQGDYLIAEEHAVTAAIETVVSLLTGMLDQPTDAPLIAVATAEGDDHSLPARAAAAHLLYLGYRTTFLGPSIPGPDLGEFLETEPPAALVLSTAMTIHLLGARSVVVAAHQLGVPVVVGGKGFGSDGVWSAAVGADAWVGSLREVAAVIAGWVDHPPAQLNEPRAISEPLQGLVAVRSAVAAAAQAGLGGATVPKRYLDEIKLLLASIESALLTGDDAVVTEMLQWQRLSLVAHGLDAESVAAAVQSAVDDVSEEAGQVLRRAMQATAS